MQFFKKKWIFKKLGLIIIDEQHKFGVNQRKKLSDKGGKDCDVLIDDSYTNTKNFNNDNLWRYGSFYYYEKNLKLEN